MNKKQYERYKAIDRILRSVPEGLTLDSLLERVNATLPTESKIKRRQLQYDITELHDRFDAPISIKQGQRTIRYEDSTYSVVTHEMEKTLHGLEDFLHDNDDNQRLKWLHNLLIMLQDTYSSEPMAVEAIDFGDNREYESGQRIHEFFNHIMNRHVLELEYFAGFGPSVRYTVHPYFIRQYNNRWFLFGWCDADIDTNQYSIINLALDRIGKVKTVNARFRAISVDELRSFKEQYFGDIVGVTRLNRPTCHLVLRFRFDTADHTHNRYARKDYLYLKSKPFYPYIHFPSDQSVEELGYADVSMDIIPNKELETVLLRYCDTATIVEPQELKELIIERSESIIRMQRTII